MLTEVDVLFCKEAFDIRSTCRDQDVKRAEK